MSPWSSSQKLLAKPALKDKWKIRQVSYFPFLFMVFFQGMTHSFRMPREKRRRSRKGEGNDTSNGRSSSSSLVPLLQTNPITILPVHSLGLSNIHTTTSLCSSKCLIKKSFCTKDCKVLDKIYIAGCAESRGVKLPKVKKHNCLPFLS